MAITNMNNKIKISEEMRTIWKYENEILDLIDNQDDYTRSDLQGRISAIVMQMIREVKRGE